MSLKPEGEDLREAVKWISAESQFSPQKQRMQLIEAACLKFNLSPKDAEFLFRCLKEKQAEGGLG